MKSAHRKVLVGIIVILIVSLFSVAQQIVSSSSAASYNGSDSQEVCSLPGNNVSSSIFYPRTPDIETTAPGVFLEDENSGNVFWCAANNDASTGNVTLIGQAPAGAGGEGYYGMGGYDTARCLSNGCGTLPKHLGVVLVMTSYVMHGMWFCYFATDSKCLNGTSGLIVFPSSYCSTLKTRTCNPYGTALDGNLNVYWVDPYNQVFTECTSASNYTNCFTLRGSSALAGYEPIGLALINETEPYLGDGGWTFYITDHSCFGNVWMGNGTTSLSLVDSIGDSLEGIGTTTNDVGHTQQLLVGDTGFCSRSAARIIDLSNSSQGVPTIFSTPTPIIGISVCWGQCLQNKTNARQLFYTASGSVFSSEAESRNESVSKK